MSVANQRGRGDVVVKRQGRLLLACFGLALSLVLSAWCVAWAEPVPPGQAATAATRFVSEEIARGAGYQRAVGALPATQIVGSARLLVDPEDKSTLGYVYELEPVGYIVVTSDTRLTPVIAFSYESDFSWDEDPNNVLLHMLRQDLSLRMDAADAEALAPAAAAANETDWGSLLSPPAPSQDGGWSAPNPPGNGTVVYGPWLTTYWDQYSPYNDDCPTDPVTDDTCVVGCAGTALAQVINYWQCPTSVSFPASADYTTDTRGIEIDASTADFTGLDYNGCRPSDEAIADLCFAVGVSLEMDYTSLGSGAYVAHWPRVLAGNWSPWDPPPERWGFASADLRSYDADTSWWNAPYYTTETSFYDQLAASMTLARPAGMNVETASGSGHAIAVDGWMTGGRVFHVNFGWTAYADGWYSLPTGMPEGYSVVRLATINIYPTATTHTLTTQTTGAGTVSHLPAVTNLSAGTHVLVTATPSLGSAFDHWEGDASGTENPLRVIMDGNKTVHAVFRAASTAWSDDMESGQNWTTTGLWHRTQQTSHSTSHAQWYGQEATGNYETGGRSSGFLTSPAIDVSGTDSVTISFRHWRCVFYHPSFSPSDRTSADYRLDAGVWMRFWEEDSRDGPEQSWHQTHYEVTTTGASTLQVRFGFDTVYSDYEDDYPGWFIDDVAVHGPSTAPPDTAAAWRVDATGNVLADGSLHASEFLSGSADVAEWVRVAVPVEAGDVLELDPARPRAYRRCVTACSSLVAGVVSSDPGVVLAERTEADERALLALSGIVPVKVTNEGGPIQPGDLLVASSTPGHAMRWSGSAHCPCSLVGKAMEAMTDESGMILVLLTAH